MKAIKEIIEEEYKRQEYKIPKIPKYIQLFRYWKMVISFKIFQWKLFRKWKKLCKSVDLDTNDIRLIAIGKDDFKGIDYGFTKKK